MIATDLRIGEKYRYLTGDKTINVLYFKHTVNHRLFVNNNLEIIQLAEQSVKEFITEYQNKV